MPAPGKFAARLRALVSVAAAFACLLAVSSLALPSPARAQLTIDITSGTLRPLPIAIVPFTGTRPEATKVGQDIASVVTNDLEGSGLFKPIDPRAFIATSIDFETTPRFADWRKIAAEALVHGKTSFQPDGRLVVEFRLWDVFAGRPMTGLRFVTEPENWRRISHLVADSIYERLTGEQGYFDSRIVYVSESGPAQKRVKRLAIMDQDGANHSYLTDGSYLVLTPRFSPSSQEITYLSYDTGRPRVHILNIDTGQREVLGQFKGMTFAPRFSPDGNSIVFSMAERGNSDVYVMDLRTRSIRRLTDDPAIDTSPDFSPDGRRIVFNSDRSGSAQLYIMDANGGNVERITFGDGTYTTPVWSPRGDLVAFTKSGGGTFAIGVVRTDGSRERILAQGYLVEGPTWSPNGRVIMYFQQDRNNARGGGGRTRLHSVDVTGANEREIPTPNDASDPAWSPLSP